MWTSVPKKFSHFFLESYSASYFIKCQKNSCKLPKNTQIDVKFPGESKSEVYFSPTSSEIELFPKNTQGPSLWGGGGRAKLQKFFSQKGQSKRFWWQLIWNQHMSKYWKPPSNTTSNDFYPGG